MARLEFLSKLKERIKDVPISEIIELRIKSYGYDRYLCPFHDDHTPNNFKINKAKNTFHCYACGANGDAIQFIQDYDNISFSEAIIRISIELGFISGEKIQETEIEKVRNYVSTIKTVESIEIANADTLDKIYRIFMRGNSLVNKDLLNPEHLQSLKEDRMLSEKEIQEIGYFTFPGAYIMRPFLKELQREGFDIDVLKTIPGFYYDVKNESYGFSKLKGTNGIGIPIVDIDGKVVGIQIRKDTLKKDNESRYQWFSSAFTQKPNVKNFKYGTSPGTPISVIYPKEIECRTIFVTEGHFKAQKLSKTFGAIALSVQGVGNWRDIPEIIQELNLRNEYLNYVMIAYDADMARKETVLNPALKLGLNILDDEMSDEINESITKILTMGNKTEKMNASVYKNEANLITQYLTKTTRKSNYHIYYCVWDELYGKGIDDLLNDGHRSLLKKVDIVDFWKYSYDYLSRLDTEKYELSKVNKTEYRKTSVPEKIKSKHFYEAVFSKIINQ